MVFNRTRLVRDDSSAHSLPVEVHIRVVPTKDVDMPGKLNGCNEGRDPSYSPIMMIYSTMFFHSVSRFRKACFKPAGTLLVFLTYWEIAPKYFPKDREGGRVEPRDRVTTTKSRCPSSSGIYRRHNFPSSSDTITDHHIRE